MADNTSIEDLLDEILLEIFSYLEVKDIIGSVQHVCSRWKELCSTTKLWKTLMYRPDCDDSDESIVNFLKDAPKLTSINFDHAVVGPKVIKTLAHNCGNITKLKLGSVKAFDYELLKEFQRNCPYLEHLTVDDTLFCDSRMGEIIAKFNNLKSFIVIQDFCVSKVVNLKQIADGCPKLEHLEVPNRIRTSEEIQYLLEKKKDHLKYLGIICWTEDGNCTLPLLSVCSRLNTLHINRVCNSHNIEGLQLSENSISLTTFRWTHLGTTNVNRIMEFFCSNNFCELKELILPLYTNYEDSLMDVIINYCPLLRKLHLPRCENLSDKSLKKLNKLKHLQSVDFSASKISDYGVRFLDLCEQLQYVDLSCCCITGRVVLAMKRLARLRILILDGCNIKGIHLEVIPTHLQALRKLSVCYCYGIKKEDIEHLRRRMPLLYVAH